MKKKTLFGVFALLVVYTVCAADSENDFRVTPIDGGRSVEITRYMGGKQTVNIPSRIGGKPVTSIGKEAFKDAELIRITIPGGVTKIGDNAFAGCLLTSVTIPRSVTEININAFPGRSLTSITIGPGVRIIRNPPPPSNTATNTPQPNSQYATTRGYTPFEFFCDVCYNGQAGTYIRSSSSSNAWSRK